MDTQLSRNYLLLLTFWTGLVTLSIEVFSFRSMALILSSSIVVTSIIIALVIISLSFGYYLSIGVQPEKRIKQIARGLVVVCCGLPAMALIAPLATRLLGPFTYSDGHLAAIAATSFVALMILTVPLPLFLGYVSPLLFSVLRRHYPSDQETAAKSFIASGIGSLLGSIVPNLLLIPLIGMMHSYLALAGMTALLLTRLLPLNKALLLLSLVAAISMLISLLSNKLYFRDNIAVSETPYQTIFVWKRPKSDVVTMSFNAQIGNQSYLDEQLAYRSHSYFDNVLLFLLQDYPNKKEVLMLGSAGATISTIANRYLGDTIDLSFTNVDIDPEVHRLAKRWFNADHEGVRFVSEDARSFIRTDSQLYDLVILDVYVNELFIPATLYSVEFFQQVRRRLKPGGIVTMNVNAKGEQSPIIQAGLGSLAKSFDHVYVTTKINEGATFAPILISASQQAIDFQKMADANPAAILHRELGKMPARTRKVEADNLPYIEDDSAMTEYLSIATFTNQ